MRTLIWFIHFWLYQIAVLPRYFIFKSKDKKGENIQDQMQPLVQKWAQSMVKMSGSSVKVVGEENIPDEGPIVFVANHQSNFDIPIMLGYLKRPKGFIAKKETENFPIVGGWMRFLKCIFMDRTSPRAALKAIKEGINVVKEGYALVIFPEGTRSLDGKMGEFKPGSFKLATKAEARIIPVTISGSYDIMKKGSMKIKPAEVTVTVSEPVSSTQYESADSYLLREEVFKIIESKL
ncbi:1-acyl-sn-glycerol-3-phosphate acyltransferase [Acidaminobacter sp. JC074]|uniref:lysophospholipid acyltransferase family protein n=1 Tax=Acidaminobacter sp. JC074 TaxID=2530199 RepID=UPI001F0EF50E|nr:lysophospholipid acyltransferase family protein [Acidaminobacter sp. JC074]